MLAIAIAFCNTIVVSATTVINARDIITIVNESGITLSDCVFG